MLVNSSDAYSIYTIFDNVILSKSGAYTLCYQVTNAEPYSLDGETLDLRHQQCYQAFKVLAAGTYVHKQDAFVLKQYDGENIKGDSFLQRSDRAYFKGREYIEHTCILTFSIANLYSLEASYQKNPLLFKQSLEKKDKDRITDFLDAVSTCISILRGVHQMSVMEMKEQDVKKYIKSFVNAFGDENSLTDLTFDKTMSYGKNHAAFFSISDENYLPSEIFKYVEDNTLQSVNTFLQTSYMERIGIHMPANHVYNQVLFFEGSTKLKDELSLRVGLFGNHKSFSAKIAIQHKQLAKLEENVAEDASVLVRSHFNIMVWHKEEETFNKSCDKIREALKQKYLLFYEPTHQGSRNIFLGCVLGNNHLLSPSYYFLTELSIALCFFTHYTNYKEFTEGTIFMDRLYQKPILVDLWQADKQFMNARNGMIVASTGGGKSVTALNIIQQNLERGIKQIVVEFGQSFSSLIKLYPDTSIHIKYDGKTPLGINPFRLNEGEAISNEKIRTLVQIVIKFWRIKDIREDMKQVTSLNKIIKNYYTNISSNHSFEHFYAYVKENNDAILKSENIDQNYFDTQSFLHICSEFLPGGMYENVTKTSDIEDKMLTKDFVVFELTEIKKDPFLISIIMLILFDTVENKILSDRSVRGELYFDEYAETATLKDIFTGEDIHSTTSFCFQKFRKENGAVRVIIQSPSQLPDNNYTKSMIANSQLLIVLPTTETVYEDIIKMFSIKTNRHIQLMKSIKNNFSTAPKYSEVFVRFEDKHAIAVRLELSPKKYLAFQSEGEIWARINQLSLKYKGNMEEAINEYQTIIA
jgi:conjugal transfer ATP-binding protein TraC